MKPGIFLVNELLRCRTTGIDSFGVGTPFNCLSQMPSRSSITSLCSASGFLIWWVVALGTTQAQGLLVQRDAVQWEQARKTEAKAVVRKDSVLLAEAYYQYGQVYNQSGDNLNSKRYFLKALRILEPRGDSYALGRVYLRLSENLSIKVNSTEDIRYAQLSLGVFRRIHSRHGMAQAYANLGGNYHWRWADYAVLKKDTSKYNRILYCYQQVERLGRQLNDTSLIAEGNNRLGTLLTTTRDPQAIRFLQRALDLFTLKKSDTARVHIMTELASTYTTFGLYGQARRTLDQARQLYAAHGFDEYHMLTHLELVSLVYFKKTNQWKQAFDCLWRLKYRGDNQFLASQDGTIARLKLEYETQRKETELKARRQELMLRTENLRTQRLLTLSAVILSVLAVAVSIIFFRLNHKNQRISRRNAELVKEQNHRVKNNLQVVSSLLNLYANRLADPHSRMAVEESQLRVEMMALLQRRLYDGDRLAVVDLAEFLPELVEGVLQTYGYGAVQADFSLAGCELSADQALPVGLIINELATNACKYAFPNTPTPAFAVSAIQNRNSIELTVADNGPGLPPLTLSANGNASRQPATFGLRIIQMQVEQLRGDSRLASDNGTRFTMTFPRHA